MYKRNFRKLINILKELDFHIIYGPGPVPFGMYAFLWGRRGYAYTLKTGKRYSFCVCLFSQNIYIKIEYI
jgi:hypothetical protein